LLGICFDPDFVNNHYVYLFVTSLPGSQQVIRYTDANDVGTAKTVILSGMPTHGNNHDGGAIGIGRDGKIYCAIGDNGSSDGVNGDLLSMASKVIRLNRDGTVPNDNPFTDGAGPNNDYIWARGFRNPFTLTFQPSTGNLWVNTVGGNYEQIFVVNRGDPRAGILMKMTSPAAISNPSLSIARTEAIPDRLAPTARFEIIMS
jgi:glucose/arabinose dehydrogenase